MMPGARVDPARRLPSVATIGNSLPHVAVAILVPSSPHPLFGALQEQYVEDLAFLKDQMITTEVNIARVFNHDVKLRKKAKEAAGGGSAPLGAAATVAALK